jgi:hypothetical protein
MMMKNTQSSRSVPPDKQFEGTVASELAIRSSLRSSAAKLEARGNKRHA